MISKDRTRHLHMGCGEPLKALSGLDSIRSHALQKKSTQEIKPVRKRTSGNRVG